MRILYLVYNTIGKGTYWRALHFARHLVKRNHTVTLVTTARQRKRGIVESVIDGVQVVEMPDLLTGSLRSGWDLWNTVHRLQWLRGAQFDLVHAFEARPTVLLPALYLKYRLQTPLVFDWADWLGRGGSVEERANPLLRALLRPLETGFEERFRRQAVGNTIICTTLQQKALALGIPAATMLLLPNGADTARFQPVDQLGARQRVGLAADAVYIGYCGTIFQRDAILMAQAFDLLHQQYPTTRLLVIGYCPVDLRTLVQTPAAVIQTGFVDNAQINDYLNACDICWLPLCDTNANRGRWPLKLSDYMAVGRPIVATAVGDVIPLFEQEPIGLLALDQPEPFAAQTAKLVADADLRARLGQRAREVALIRYDWGKLTDQLLEFYTKAIPKK